MKRTIGIFSIFFFSSVITACGAESSIVGGRCAQGFSPQGDRCVADSSGSSGEAPIDPSEAGTPKGDRVIDATSTVPGTTIPDPIETHPIKPIDPPNPVEVKPIEPIIVVNPELPIEPPIEEKCEEPLVRCKGECMDVMQNDPQNCGACGKTCRSNICQAGVCQGATPGDVILVGHDMQDAWAGSAHSKVLGNAIGIPTTDPIRVLVWEQGAPAKTVAWTKTLIKQSVSRKVDLTSASTGSLTSSTLATDYDIVLIHDAAGSDPEALGLSWADSLETFTKKGGVVIALDGFQSDMPTLVKKARLLDVDGHVQLTASTKFVVSDPKDVVGTQLLSPYAAIGASVGFTGAAPISSAISWVVREKNDDSTGLPTVIHRVVY